MNLLSLQNHSPITVKTPVSSKVPSNAVSSSRCLSYYASASLAVWVDEGGDGFPLLAVAY